MNMYLKHQDSWFYLYYVQSEIPGRPYRRSANHAIRTNDGMHHSVQLGHSSMILEFIRGLACIGDPASIRTNEVWPPACIDTKTRPNIKNPAWPNLDIVS